MTVKERLIEYLKYANISYVVFGRTIGVSPSYINSMRVSIQPSKIERIVENYPDLNIEWLLTGEGSMLNNDPTVIAPVRLIPLYDVEVSAGIDHDIGNMINTGSLLQNSELALKVYGNSMLPNFSPGCIVFARRHTDSFIEPGVVYIVETKDNRYLRRLYLNKDKTALRCVSDNEAAHESVAMAGELYYPEFEIPLDEVIGIYLVVGTIIINAM